MPKETTINLDKTIAQSDEWSDWLLHNRHADNPDFEQVVRSAIERYADRVLDGARLVPGMTLADIGTGDGLIALRAIDRIGASLRVLLADISEPMLRHAEALAAQCTAAVYFS
jgi:arsenite methyltransferase